MLPISQQYLKAKCEIKTVDGHLLASGFLIAMDEEKNTIKVGPETDFLPTIHCNTLVKINVFGQDLEFKSLVGKVFLSNSDQIQISDLQNYDDFDRRGYFRLRLNLHTQASPALPDGAPIQPAEVFQIYITDLSLSGCFIKTRKTLEIGDYFIAVLPLEDKRVSFLCKVRRVQRVNSRSNGYGCSFENNTTRQFDLLCKFIFDKQREQIRSSRKDLY
jgi:Tfp pilus assembly protein PilZ